MTNDSKAIRNHFQTARSRFHQSYTMKRALSANRNNHIISYHHESYHHIINHIINHHETLQMNGFDRRKTSKNDRQKMIEKVLPLKSKNVEIRKENREFWKSERKKANCDNRSSVASSVASPNNLFIDFSSRSHFCLFCPS